MTAKQTSILTTATRMFADEGFDAVSTARIAKEANVSEGLIFRHFGSKRGLLNAILTEGEKRQAEKLKKFEAATDPNDRILAIIEDAFSPSSADSPYKALALQLASLGDATYENKGETAEKMLKEAFAELGYEDPETEARFLYHSLQGIGNAAAAGELKKSKKLQTFVKAMYA